MRGTTRRSALNNLLMLLMAASLAPSAVQAAPVAQPAVVLPGWLAEEPRVADALARIVAAAPSPGPKLRGHIVKCFEAFADVMELTHRQRA